MLGSGLGYAGATPPDIWKVGNSDLVFALRISVLLAEEAGICAGSGGAAGDLWAAAEGDSLTHLARTFWGDSGDQLVHGGYRRRPWSGRHLWLRRHYQFVASICEDPHPFSTKTASVRAHIRDARTHACPHRELNSETLCDAFLTELCGA